MTDHPAELRQIASVLETYGESWHRECLAAADEIERLRAENERLRRPPAFLDAALNEGDGVYRP